MLESQHLGTETAHIHFSHDAFFSELDSEDHDETSHSHLQVIESVHSTSQARSLLLHSWVATDRHSIIQRTYKPHLPPPSFVI